MPAKEVCTIQITCEDRNDHFREEDMVKQYWPYMLPFFTRRHGVNHGEIKLDDGVSITWRYETAGGEEDIGSADVAADGSCLCHRTRERMALEQRADLLKALTEAVRLFESYGLVARQLPTDPAAAGRWIGNARAAIARATRAEVNKVLGLPSETT